VKSCVVLLAATLLLAAPVSAHKKHLSNSRWRFVPADGVMGVTIGFESSDLGLAIDLGKTPLKNARGTPERFKEFRALVYKAMGETITVTNNGDPCPMRPLRLLHKKYYEVGLRWDCETAHTSLVVDMGYLRRLPPDHKQVAKINTGDRVDVRSFTRERTVYRHTFAPPVSAVGEQPRPQPEAAPAADEAQPLTGAAGFKTLLWEGAVHIATGWDHILFLLALLAIGGSLRYLIAIVTAFTVAHSITLALAYLELVSLDSRLIESAIALSIVYVAAENVWITRTDRRWILTFVFGLIHGLGFAGFLGDLELPRDQLAMTLFSFNLGVELGQLAVVAVTYPLIHWAARQPWHRRAFVLPLSAAVGLAGAWWFVERAFLGA